MERLYYTDPYLTECMATVLDVKKTDTYIEVLTDRTVFYPTAGGQPGDTGVFGEFTVLGTEKNSLSEPVLLLPLNANVETGKQYRAEIDWKRRYTYMVYHTAQHLLSGLLYSLFKIGTVAVHLGEDYISIETDRAVISKEQREKLMETANFCTRTSHAVSYRTMTYAEAEALNLRRSVKVREDVRIVEIEGIDRIACGGVHVNNTNELGLIVYAGTEELRGHARLFFKVADAALSYVFSSLDCLNEIKRELGISEKEVLPKIKQLINQVALQKREINILSEKNASIQIKEQCKGACMAVFETDSDLSYFAKCVNSYENLALFVYNKENWLLAVKGEFKDFDFDNFKKTFFSAAEACGGGRDGFFRGSYKNREGFLSFVEKFSFDKSSLTS